MKHRIVEHMSSSTADALGLSRAILCNGELQLGIVLLFFIVTFWWIQSLCNLQQLFPF